MTGIQIHPPERLNSCVLNPGGSKSISNRLLILREVFNGSFSISHLSRSEDTLVLQQALEQIRAGSGAKIHVKQAGTVFRFLTAYLSTREGEWEIGGSDRLNERPVTELVEALRELGAEIEYLGASQKAPLRIRGRKLFGGKLSIHAGTSSQFITALLMIAPLLNNGLELDLQSKPVSLPYIRMTVELMKYLGADVEHSAQKIRVSAKPPLLSGTKHISVESDWSSASYWFSLCALMQNSEIQLAGLSKQSLQADAVLPALYENLGVSSQFNGEILHLQQKGKAHSEFEYNFVDCPDIAMTVACTCMALKLDTRLAGLKTLQLKESRRLDALCSDFRKFGINPQTTPDTFVFDARSLTPFASPVQVDTFQDHRLAMSFAPLSIHYPGLIVEDPEVVNKSYPEFWNDLQSLGFRLNLLSC
ncbi:MAG TPA: 3-phosphoshikimate 1-carboxyvinyltransferase [Bacteroidia bacterium]|nr:3-phosphoshikimate 1-carboxyvinyltransferase [Bacteroidia bacterium]